MKIGLLGCDDTPQRLLHVAPGYRDMFQRLLVPHVPRLELEWFDVLNGALPERPDACDAYICTGSRYSVYDDRDWIAKLMTFVRELHAARKPFVGICFGHQALAQALGGEVAPAEQGWGVGVHEMSIVRREPWMQPALSECRIQYMHADQVQRLPPGSVVLAAAPHCPVAMFRVEDTMLGIEGHPEFPAAYVGALVEIRKDRIGAEKADAALAGLDTPVDDHVVARWIANFISSRNSPEF
jgi:GMP synthase-like glutamine amidotransferase